MLLAFWFVARLMGDQVPQLERYGGNYFSFVLLAYAPLEYLRVSIWGFSARIREAQSLGTLEALLVTPVGIPTVLFGSVAYPFAWATLRAVGFLLIAGWADDRLGAARWDAVALMFLLSMVVFGAIGILSASFIMVFKKGDPISPLFFGASTLFSGLFFPTQMLGPLQWISKLMPLTYAAETSRLGMLGATWTELAPELAKLALFAAALIPTAAWAFRHALDRARRDGTLAHY
jgi:ABC-2 type transport system permease protein